MSCCAMYVGILYYLASLGSFSSDAIRRAEAQADIRSSFRPCVYIKHQQCSERPSPSVPAGFQTHYRSPIRLGMLARGVAIAFSPVSVISPPRLPFFLGLSLLLSACRSHRHFQPQAEDLGPQAARAAHGPSAAMGTALAQRPA